MTAERSPASLYAYYEQRDTSPTFARLADPSALERYAADRAMVMEDRLGWPVAAFRDAEILEFGPDTGENALVFALWGGRLTLVEPNPKALPQIRDYFQRFGLERNLEALSQDDVLEFRSDRRFDAIIAEGFIYTLPDDHAWLARFAELLRPGGRFLISYYERSGALIELTLKVVLVAARAALGGESEALAERFFGPKWASIGHTRRFESWVMDVLENPFVRLGSFYDAARLCRNAAEHGFAVSASWPAYQDKLEVYWHKRHRDPAELLEAGVDHIDRSRLSFLLGSKAYIVDGSAAAVRERIDALLAAVDRQIDAPEPAAAAQCVALLEALAELIRGPGVLTDDDGAAGGAMLDCLVRLFGCLADEDIEALETLCRSDPAFIASWGLPVHLAVFQKPRQP